jgi:hypothetical protein
MFRARFRDWFRLHLSQPLGHHERKLVLLLQLQKDPILNESIHGRCRPVDCHGLVINTG